MVARLPVGQRRLRRRPAWRAALPRTDSPTAALERIFEHRKKRAQTSPVPVTPSVGRDRPGHQPLQLPHQRLPGDGHRRRRPRLRRVVGARLRRGPIRAPIDGDARIRVATTLDGATFSAPVVVDDSPTEPGPPADAVAGLRRRQADARLLRPARDARRRSSASSSTTQLPRPTASARPSTSAPRSGTPGATPAFAPSVRVSDYLMGYRNSTVAARAAAGESAQPADVQAGHGALHRRLHRRGARRRRSCRPAGGDWVYNTASNGQIPVFHAVWTDNRDVRPPLDGNWANYTPPTINGQFPGTSLFDPTQTGGRVPGRQRRLAQPEHLHRAHRRRPAGRRARQRQAAVAHRAARLRRLRAEPDHGHQDVPHDACWRSRPAAAPRSSSSRVPPYTAARRRR